MSAVTARLQLPALRGGMVMARGGLQVAAGKQGIEKIQLPTLNVLSHEPHLAAQQITTDLPVIRIELSHDVRADAPLTNFVQVLSLDPSFGEDVTSRLFDVGFAQGADGPQQRILELRLHQGSELLPGTRYYVRVRKGLAPLAGLPLDRDYVFFFTTSLAGRAAPPDIVGIDPDTGSIAGGTSIVVYGKHFGASPELYIGGQRLVIDNYQQATDYDRIFARTLPNNAGAAAVEVVGEAGMRDVWLGGFTYVDLLKISFINPAVVRVSQSGANDLVDVVGYGFHAGVSVRVWPSGKLEQAVEYAADNDHLDLYSAEKMRLQVPDFGSSYRGFADVEVRDAGGRSYTLANGLFYGRLQIDREIGLDTIDLAHLPWIPAETKLPPGFISDIASDPDLSLIYVLGRGRKGLTLEQTALQSQQQLNSSYAPGWISLVRYDRADLTKAAPMHGLGYFNLPAELQPASLACIFLDVGWPFRKKNEPLGTFSGGNDVMRHLLGRQPPESCSTRSFLRLARPGHSRFGMHFSGCHTPCSV